MMITKNSLFNFNHLSNVSIICDNAIYLQRLTCDILKINKYFVRVSMSNTSIDKTVLSKVRTHFYSMC